MNTETTEKASGRDNLNSLVSNPSDEEIIDCILDNVFIRGIDLDVYRREFTEKRSGLPSELRKLFTGC